MCKVDDAKVFVFVVRLGYGSQLIYIFFSMSRYIIPSLKIPVSTRVKESHPQMELSLRVLRV